MLGGPAFDVKSLNVAVSEKFDFAIGGLLSVPVETNDGSKQQDQGFLYLFSF